MNHGVGLQTRSSSIASLHASSAECKLYHLCAHDCVSLANIRPRVYNAVAAHAVLECGRAFVLILEHFRIKNGLNAGALGMFVAAALASSDYRIIGLCSSSRPFSSPRLFFPPPCTVFLIQPTSFKLALGKFVSEEEEDAHQDFRTKNRFCTRFFVWKSRQSIFFFPDEIPEPT